MVLWVPKMLFNSEGAAKFLSDYLKPHTCMAYLKERIETSPVLQARQGTFRLTSSISRPRHVFIWILNSAKLNDQKENPFVFNTYNIANGGTISDCQLELSNGVFYPTERLKPGTELIKTYRTLMGYGKQFNSYFTAPIIDVESFKNLYGILYFDLTNQESSMKNSETKIEFRYTLNDAPNAEFFIQALILHEEKLSVDVINGKAMLKN